MYFFSEYASKLRQKEIFAAKQRVAEKLNNKYGLNISDPHTIHQLHQVEILEDPATIRLIEDAAVNALIDYFTKG